jgi:putative phosphoribosyl transferase
MYNKIFKNRTEAGILLSDQLKKYQNSNTVVLAIPRGGVPIGYEIAKNLHLPLDIVLSKKIGHPYNSEFAIGAVSIGSMVVNEELNIPKEYIDTEISRLKKVLQEKYKLYRGNHEPIGIKGKNIIVVDDGIATGNTLLACIAMLRKKNPLKIIVAVPVVPDETVSVFEGEADEFIYLTSSKYFTSVGAFYEEFEQVEDDEVIEMLKDTSPTRVE